MAAKRAVRAVVEERSAAPVRGSPIIAELLADERSESLTAELGAAVDSALQELAGTREQLKASGRRKLPEQSRLQDRCTDALLAVLPFRAIKRAAELGETEQMALHDPLTMLKGRPYLGRVLDAVNGEDAKGHAIVMASVNLDNLSVISTRWSHAQCSAAIVAACRVLAECTRQWNANYEEHGCGCFPIHLGGGDIVLPVIISMPLKAPLPSLDVLLEPCRQLMSTIHTSVCNHLEEMFPFDAVDRSGAIKARGPSISIGVSSPVECGPGQQPCIYESYKVQAEATLNRLKERWKNTIDPGGRGGGVEFCDDELRDRVGKEVSEHVRALKSGGIAARERAAAALWNLARSNPRNEVTIAQAGAIVPLVTLLQTGSAVAKENAAAALASLASNTPANQLAIVQAGAAAPLAAVLSQGSDRAKEGAVAAIANLAANPANQLTIAQAGTLEPLVEQLSSGAVVVRENAAAALANLATNSTENGRAVARAGAILPLVAMLNAGGGCENETAALASLASNSPENQLAIAQAGAVAPLVALLSCGSPVAQENATAVLWNLASNPQNQAVLDQANAITPLVTLLSRGSILAKTNAAATLTNLAADSTASQLAIMRGGAVAPLVGMLSISSAEAKEHAASALRNLAANTANHRTLTSAGVVAPLVALLGGDGPVAAEHAAATLFALSCQDGDGRRRLQEVPAAVDALQRLRYSGQPQARRFAEATLTALGHTRSS